MDELKRPTADHTEKMLRWYCDKEGIDIYSLSANDMIEILPMVEEEWEEEKRQNGQFGAGA